MNRYVLLQRPILPGEDTAPIVIIDNSKESGKHRVQKMIMNDYKHIGFIESDETVAFLNNSFNYKFYVEENKHDEFRYELNQLIDKYNR